jgi:hypothetical protein
MFSEAGGGARRVYVYRLRSSEIQNKSPEKEIPICQIQL